MYSWLRTHRDIRVRTCRRHIAPIQFRSRLFFEDMILVAKAKKLWDREPAAALPAPGVRQTVDAKDYPTVEVFIWQGVCRPRCRPR